MDRDAPGQLDGTSGTRPPGRPLDADLTDRLVDGALALVSERGLDEFSSDALATAIGAGKAAIYRRWPDTHALLGDALRGCRVLDEPVDTGSLRGDLVALLDPRTQVRTRDERAAAAVVGQARYSSELRSGLEVALVRPVEESVAVVAGRHAARGHVVADARVSLLRRLVLALWWQRWIDGATPCTGAEIEVLVGQVLQPVLADRS